MWLSSEYGLHGLVCALCNVWACSWWVGRWMHRDVKSHRCSIGFRSGEREGQSMASMSSSSRNCLHTLGAWGRALSCTRRTLDQHETIKCSLDVSLAVYFWSWGTRYKWLKIVQIMKICNADHQSNPTGHPSIMLTKQHNEKWKLTLVL